MKILVLFVIKGDLMKRYLLVLLTSVAFADEATDLLKVDTLEASQTPGAISTVDRIEQEITAGIKQKCDLNGCILFVDEGNGNEFKVTVGAGEGPNYAANGGGINIYGTSSQDQYYGITFSYVHSNHKCVRKVPEGTYKLVEAYQKLMSSKEYVERVFSAWKKGEDLQTPDAIKTALSVLVSVKPSQGNCGRLNNN
jgi:hypothetical protein